MTDDKVLSRARAKLDKALEANRLEDALPLLVELRKWEPDNARWPHKHGDLLRKLGRQADAVHCYATAVGLYADQGFIARAVAMAKTVVEMDPTRLDVLQRVDPQAAQQLRAYKRPPPRRAALLDDGPMPVLPLAPASVPPTSGVDRMSLPPRRPTRAALAMATAPVPVSAPRAAQPPPRPPTAAVPPPPPAPESGTGRLGRPRPGPPPPPPPRISMVAPPPVPTRVNMDAPLPPQLLAAALSLAAPPPPLQIPTIVPRRPRLDDLSVPLKPPSDMQDFYRRALGTSQDLAPDPRAAANETRFSDIPTPNGLLVADEAFSDVELTPRTPVPRIESTQPEPMSAQTLAKLPLFPLFAELPKPALTRLIQGSTLIELGHDAYAVRSGEPADALYGIIEGSVNIIVPGQAFQLTLAEGDVFGEASLFANDRYHADVIVTGRLLALRVPRTVMLTIAQEYAPLVGLLLQLLTRRLLGNLLQVSPLFQDFDVAGKSELARMFEVRRAAADTMLAVVGKKMDGLYISLTGLLRVNQPGAPVRIAPAGSMFGQSTILTQAASQVDVIAQNDMLLLRLPHAQFARVAMQYPTVLARLTELSTSEVVRVTL